MSASLGMRRYRALILRHHPPTGRDPMVTMRPITEIVLIAVTERTENGEDREAKDSAAQQDKGGRPFISTSVTSMAPGFSKSKHPAKRVVAVVEEAAVAEEAKELAVAIRK